MGFKATFTGFYDPDLDGDLQITGYSVQEASTPLAAGDSTGQVGTISLTVPLPDPHLPGTPSNPWTVLRDMGGAMFAETQVELFDTHKGSIPGTVVASSTSQDGGSVELTAFDTLSRLNIYNVTMGPYGDTELRDVFAAYFQRAGLVVGEYNLLSIPSNIVSIPGWEGELWYHLKMLATAHDLDILAIEGVVYVRPIRGIVVQPRRGTARAHTFGAETLAQSVEVYKYDNRYIVSELVYPIGGWRPEVQVLNVNAGEEVEYTLELSSSLTSIQTPVMQTFVSEDYSSSSVYTIVADDGLPVPPAIWAENGGLLTVAIAPNTRSLIVNLRGATGVPTAAGVEATNFSVALASDTSGNRYSTLRIVGTGVAFNKQKRTIRTGVPASRTGTEVGVTVDNPFISSVDQLYRTGTRASKRFAGAQFSLSGTVATLDSDQGPVFGAIAGARVFDAGTKRWYRIRNATLTPERVSFGTADDDLTWGDVDGYRAGRTYGDIQTLADGMSYSQFERRGLV